MCQRQLNQFRFRVFGQVQQPDGDANAECPKAPKERTSRQILVQMDINFDDSATLAEALKHLRTAAATSTACLPRHLMTRLRYLRTTSMDLLTFWLWLFGSPMRSLQSAKFKVITEANVQSSWWPRYPWWRIRIIEQGQDATTNRSSKDAFPSVGGSVKAQWQRSCWHGFLTKSHISQYPQWVFWGTCWWVGWKTSRTRRQTPEWSFVPYN